MKANYCCLYCDHKLYLPPYVNGEYKKCSICGDKNLKSLRETKKIDQYKDDKKEDGPREIYSEDWKFE